MTREQFFDMLHARRRYHLRRLFAEDEMAKDLAKKLDMHPHYLSGLLSGTRPFCEKRARKIEEYAGIPFGSLDLEVGNG